MKVDFKIMIKAYYQLTKPGIIYGNLITAIAGFFLASRGSINIKLFIFMVLGVGLVIGSACVFNNIIDLKIDSKMKRTQKRPLVQKIISKKSALIYGSILGILGFLDLIIFTNLLTAFMAFIGFFFYIVMYSIWKRTSNLGVIIGSISGAMPPVGGYVSVTNRLDLGALLLFLILVFWQMPHFYAISIFRFKDYEEAGIPTLPITSGIKNTKIQMVLYIIAFVISALLLTYFHYTGNLYLVITLLLGLIWLYLSLKGFWTKNDIKWARQLFFFSLLILISISILMSVNYIK